MLCTSEPIGHKLLQAEEIGSYYMYVHVFSLEFVAMEQPLKKRRTSKESWSVPSSIIAKHTNNPIRKIVEGMKLTPNPAKEMIALSIGK